MFYFPSLFHLISMLWLFFAMRCYSSVWNPSLYNASILVSYSIFLGYTDKSPCEFVEICIVYSFYLYLPDIFKIPLFLCLPSTLAWKSNGRRSLVGCSPWGHKESDRIARFHFYFSLWCTGKGNGNPLQCSCLENPRHGGAWRAAVYGVTQSQTRLKRLGSRSSRHT